jgi:membrane-associated protease RseP (regulator of RpoE activity)
MLNERALSHDDAAPPRLPVPTPAPTDESFTELRAVAGAVMRIDRTQMPADLTLSSAREDLLLMPNAQVEVAFEGALTMPSEAAWAQVDAALQQTDRVPLLRHRDGVDRLIVVRGRPQAARRPAWPNLLLFAATAFSLLLLGTAIAGGETRLVNAALAQDIADNPMLHLWRGIPYAASLLLILGAHELGHYFAARRHKLSVTLPYFIPLPSPFSAFGTMGAFIQLREPIRSRKSLLDIGAAGPLMGLVFAIPIVLIGLATSPVGPVDGSGFVEGNSLLYALSKTLVFGRFVPAGDIDVTLNQMAYAGWTGLLITAINLIPLGQLDGGHILYALIGDRARWLYYPILAGTVALTLLVSESWLIWLALLFIFGRFYAVPLDAITPLDRRRRVVAVVALVVFLVSFVPIPFTFRDIDTPASLRDSVSTLLPVALAFGTLWLRRMRRH